MNQVESFENQLMQLVTTTTRESITVQEMVELLEGATAEIGEPVEVSIEIAHTGLCASARIVYRA